MDHACMCLFVNLLNNSSENVYMVAINVFTAQSQTLLSKDVSPRCLLSQNSNTPVEMGSQCKCWVCLCSAHKPDFEKAEHRGFWNTHTDKGSRQHLNKAMRFNDRNAVRENVVYLTWRLWNRGQGSDSCKNTERGIHSAAQHEFHILPELQPFHPQRLPRKQDREKRVESERERETLGCHSMTKILKNYVKNK